MISTTAASAAEAPAPVSEAALPAHSAVYEVLRRGSKIGEVHVRLEQDDQGIWLFDTETVATARMARILGVSAEESAHFVWENGRVRMLAYRQVARAPTRTRFWQHQVDWNEGVSNTQTYDAGELRIPVDGDVLDPLTLRMQLAARLADPAQRGRDLSFRVLERDDIEDQTFYFRGEDQLSVPAGCFNSLRMERFRREGSSRNYDSWHAAAFHWMPLRILQTKDGREEIDVRLIETSLNLDPDC